VKTVEQQTLQALHRVRTQWQAARTARINVVRGLLREQGLPVPVGARTVLARVAAILEDADVELPGLLRHTVAQVVDKIRGGWACSQRRRLSARCIIFTPSGAGGSSPVGCA
jgi:transposase